MGKPFFLKGEKKLYIPFSWQTTSLVQLSLESNTQHLHFANQVENMIEIYEIRTDIARKKIITILLNATELR